MGVLAESCLGVPLYSKLEEKKNGLDVYQSVDNNRSIYKHYDNYKECYDIISFICPICKEW